MFRCTFKFRNTAVTTSRFTAAQCAVTSSATSTSAAAGLFRRAAATTVSSSFLLAGTTGRHSMRSTNTFCFTTTAAASCLTTSCRGAYTGVFGAEDQSKRRSETEEQLRAQLPEVFEQATPEAVDDYIRPDKTIFEKLEDYWDYAQTFLNPVQKQIDWMRGAHDGSWFLGTPLEWGVVFLCWGFCVRLLSLAPMLYAHRNSLRMARINPQLNEITMQQKRVKNDKSLTAAEKRVMKEGYTRMEKALYKKHGCSKRRAFVSGLMTPVMVSAFIAIRRLAMYEESLETSRFLWVTDLTMPDPYNILPVICTFLFVFNFEMNQSLSRGGRSATVLYARWAMRVGSIVFLYFFSSQPSALFAYWIGMSFAGVVQPVLLRWQGFRDYFGFPDANKVATQHKTVIDKVMDAVKYGFGGGKGVDQAEVDQAREKLNRAGAKTVKGRDGVTFQHISDEEVIFDNKDDDPNDNSKAARLRREKPRIL